MNARTPKDFEGTTRLPGVKIGEVLPGILLAIGKKTEPARDEVFQEWILILGKMAPLTQPVSFADGVLTVIVKSSTLYSLLRQHEKPQLLRKLKAKFQIKDLVFRIG